MNNEILGLNYWQIANCFIKIFLFLQQLRLLFYSHPKGELICLMPK